MVKDKGREGIRLAFKPAKVRVLFVGESPPESGAFFYYGRGPLADATMDSFSRAFKKTFSTHCDFLVFFRELGCYLDDLSIAPINHLQNRDRGQMRRHWEKSLAARMKDYDPRAVICIMKGIEQNVKQARKEAGLYDRIPPYCLPFPSWDRRQYINKLTKILCDLLHSGILRIRRGER